MSTYSIDMDDKQRAGFIAAMTERQTCPSEIGLSDATYSNACDISGISCVRCVETALDTAKVAEAKRYYPGMEVREDKKQNAWYVGGLVSPVEYRYLQHDGHLHKFCMEEGRWNSESEAQTALDEWRAT